MHLEIRTKENKANAPFHLSNFLIDTHGPKGLFSKNCTQSEQQDDIQVRGSIKCAIRNLTNKLTLWQDNHYLDNTIIVIMGDHLFMPGLSNAYLFPEERKVYFQILGLDIHKLTPKRKKLNHFDVMPTILDALGLLPNNQSYLGLGSSVFRDDPQFEKRQKKLHDTYYLFSDI